MSTTIDTLEVTKELKAAGFDQAQAEALARLARRSQDLDLSALATKAGLRAEFAEYRAATKADLAEHRAATKVDLSELRAATQTDLRREVARLELKIESVKTDIVRWMVVTQLAGGGLVVAAIKLAH